jgi:anti-sigma regulatory factor (Ser/Thr protein kinase)
MLADHLAVDLPMSADAPALARRAIEGLALADGPRATASLLASELVSNAVRHSGAGSAAAIRLHARVSGGALRLSVTDGGGGFSATADRPPPGVGGGYGLFLVEQLADAWGVESVAPTTVWLDLAVDQRAG